MVNNPNHNPTTWQSMLWRLLLTILLLTLLFESSLSMFNSVASHPNMQVLPNIPYQTVGK